MAQLTHIPAIPLAPPNIQGFERAEGKDFFDAKCSACVSIVAELERNLELEPPRQVRCAREGGGCAWGSSLY